jgi:DNA-binding response OmpR family regulator
MTETGEALKILVIDDEVAILHLLRGLLGRFGYGVTTAESATEALSLMERGKYDCVLTDAVMPEMSGYDLVKALRSDSRYAELPILMLTRKRHRQDVKLAVEAGVTDYVLKPIDENLLVEKIDLCLKKSAGPKAAPGELALKGAHSEAEVGVGCRIVSLGETSLTLRLQYRLEPGLPFQLRTRIFSEIGIIQPHLKLESCEMKSSGEAEPEISWEAKVSFDQIPESDAAKIREWSHRQALKKGGASHS